MTARRGELIYHSRCLCDCGTIFVTRNVSLTSGHTTSCGCWQRESSSKRFREQKTTHGLSKTRVYCIWKGIVQRCRNPHSPVFKHYGARGILFCERWNSFEAFFEDMGPGKSGWTIERVNNDVGYNITNCAWATRIRQARNTRRNRMYTVRGITGCISELCEKFHSGYYMVRMRLAAGWDVERAFLQPKRASRVLQ